MIGKVTLLCCLALLVSQCQARPKYNACVKSPGGTVRKAKDVNAVLQDVVGGESVLLYSATKVIHGIKHALIDIGGQKGWIRISLVKKNCSKNGKDPKKAVVRM